MKKALLIIIAVIILGAAWWVVRKPAVPPCSAGSCPVALTRADSGRALAYAVGSRFTISLPEGTDATGLACLPEGVVGRIANTPPGSNQATFETVAPGTCAFDAEGFSARITVVNPEGEQVFCTLDAKLCPDGSYVGRVPPTCEFAACPAGSAGGQGIAPYQSGVKGIITAGPTCPVARPGDPSCADKPLPTLVAVFRASDPVHAFVLTRSAADGSFSASLPPGDYVVGAGESELPRCPQTPVTVPPMGFVSITVSCDTGIR